MFGGVTAAGAEACSLGREPEAACTAVSAEAWIDDLIEDGVENTAERGDPVGIA